MRFLADERRDFAVVRALRSDGHDVLAVSEFHQRSVDAEVIELALAGNRPASARRSLGPAVLSLVREHGSQLTRAFVVLRPGAVRISYLPNVM